jgi:hypothetical protein
MAAGCLGGQELRLMWQVVGMAFISLSVARVSRQIPQNAVMDAPLAAEVSFGADVLPGAEVPFGAVLSLGAELPQADSARARAAVTSFAGSPSPATARSAC